MIQSINDSRGRCIARIDEHNGIKTYTDHTGRLLARVMNGSTFDAGGKFIGKGDLGMTQVKVD